MSDEEFEKEFRLSNEDAAVFLREIADSIEEGGQLNLKGENWKAAQPLSENVPMRIFSDNKGLEVGFKLLKPNRTQK